MGSEAPSAPVASAPAPQAATAPTPAAVSPPSASPPTEAAPLTQNLGEKLAAALTTSERREKGREAFRAAMAEKLAQKAQPATPPPPTAPAETPPEKPADTPPPAAANAQTEAGKPAEDLVGRLTSLTRAEAELLAEKQRLKEVAQRAEAYEAAKKQAATNPAAALEALGLSLQQVLDYHLNGGKPTGEAIEKSQQDALRAEVEAVKRRLDEKTKQETEASVAAAKAHYASSFAEKAKAEASKYPFAAAYGERAAQRAVQLFEKSMAEGKAYASMAPVLELVDKEFEEWATPALTVDKFKAKLLPVTPPPAAPPPTSQPGATSAARTLTNAAVAATPPRQANPTREERRARMAEAFSQRRGG